MRNHAAHLAIIKQLSRQELHSTAGNCQASFSYLEPVCCSMSPSNCCFLTCIQISQEADQVVWCSHLLKIFLQFIVIHTVKGLGIVKCLLLSIFLFLGKIHKKENNLFLFVSSLPTFIFPLTLKRILKKKTNLQGKNMVLT